MDDYNKKDTCCIFNLAAHYRESIYSLMDKELKCHFYIGDRTSSPMKLMDYNTLKGFRRIIKYVQLPFGFYWQSGAVKLAFKKYRNYIITGDPFCLSTWMILLLSRISGKNTVLWTHGWYGDETRTKRLIKKMFFALSKNILLYGDYARGLMIKEGINENKLKCVYNSLDYDMQLKTRNELHHTDIYKSHFKNDLPVLIYVGRIQTVKKIHYVLDAMRILNEKGICCNFVVVGKDVDNTGLQGFIEKYNLGEHVWLYGPCYEENVLGELFYNANLCVTPGDVGLTAIHSLSYGCPVVSHNHFCSQGPEFETIIPDVTGDFFEYDNINDLAHVIEKWLKLSVSKGTEIKKIGFDLIDKKYNPYHQVNIINSVLE